MGWWYQITAEELETRSNLHIQEDNTIIVTQRGYLKEILKKLYTKNTSQAEYLVFLPRCRIGIFKPIGRRDGAWDSTTLIQF